MGFTRKNFLGNNKWERTIIEDYEKKRGCFHMQNKKENVVNIKVIVFYQYSDEQEIKS